MSLYEKFQSPPLKYRPIPFWFWNETRENKFNADLMGEQIEQFYEKGLGGFIIFNKPSEIADEKFGFTPDEHLSPKWFDACRQAIEKGRSLKMEVWINDSFDFPPGGLGGRMKELAPEAYQRVLHFTKTDKVPDSLESLVSIIANPKGNKNIEKATYITDQKDLQDKFVGYEFLITQAQKASRPEGHLNRFPAFIDPEVNNIFITEVYGKYKSNLGDLFGNGLTGFFADCDARRASHYPWARDFDSRFENRFGYSIRGYLPALWVDFGDASKKIRYDYYSFISELYSDWFKNCFHWCKQNSLKYMYHTSDTGPFSINPDSDAYCKRSSYFIEGSFSQVNCHGDYVGTDHELMALNGGLHFDPVFKGKHTGWMPEAVIWGKSEHHNDYERVKTENKTYGDVRAKLASSNAHCKGKDGAMCEAYAATNTSATLEDLKWITDWQACQGITKFVPHAFFYSVEGTRKQFAPPNHFRQGHLWNNYKDFTDYIGRLCFMLSAGRHVADIAVIEPTQSLWKDEKFDSLVFFDLLDILNHSGWDYDVVSEEDLVKAEITEQCLTILEEKYKVVILPGLFEISQKTTDKLENFISHNGAVIELGGLVNLRNSVKLAHETFDNNFIVKANPVIKEIENFAKSDVLFYDKDRNRVDSVHFVHRKTDQQDIYFIANLEGESLKDITISLCCSESELAIWEPTTSESYALKATKTPENRVEVNIDLEFKASTFIVAGRQNKGLKTTIKAAEICKTIEMSDWQVQPETFNILPITIWKDAGTSKIYNGDSNPCSVYFEFEIQSKNDIYELVLPEVLTGLNIEINGTGINGITWLRKEVIFDASYSIYNITDQLHIGKNHIHLAVPTADVLKKIEYTPIYLRGQFRVDIKTHGNSSAKHRDWYHFESRVHDNTDIILYKTDKPLKIGNWAKQGYPFYSGKVRYKTSFDLNTQENAQNVQIVAEKLYGCANIEVNGQYAGAVNWPPYKLDISDAVKPGLNILTIVVENTQANLLEEYPEKSGIENIKIRSECHTRG